MASEWHENVLRMAWECPQNGLEKLNGMEPWLLRCLEQNSPKLNVLDRRDCVWNSIVGGFHRGEVGGKETPALNIAEHELSA